MAEVDFSNAKIAPGVTYASLTWQNPTKNTNVSLASNTFSYLYDANDNPVSTGLVRTRLKNVQKQLVYLYQGTFSTSGTEFYLVDSYAGWRVWNISFNAGDTFMFKIRADLICQ